MTSVVIGTLHNFFKTPDILFPVPDQHIYVSVIAEHLEIIAVLSVPPVQDLTYIYKDL